MTLLHSLQEADIWILCVREEPFPAGILAALYHAKLTGEGEKVETSLFETAVYNMGMMVQAANYEGIAQQYPINIREGANPFNSAWRTADDRFIQTCMPDYNMYYKQFMKALGREDLIDDERYFPIQNLQAKGLGTEMYDICMEAMSKKTAAEWQPILKEADVAFSLAQSWSEILEDEQAWANNCLYKMQYDNGNTRTLVRPPVKFQEMGVPEYKGGPLIGEQGPEILKDLGYTDEQIQEYQEKGILFVWKDDRK